MSGHWEAIICPICGDVIHRHFAEQGIVTRGRVSSHHFASAGAAFAHMIEQAQIEHLREIEAAEKDCDDHMRSRHPLRLRLWERFHWDFLLNRRWPWQSKPEFDDDFEYAGKP